MSRDAWHLLALLGSFALLGTLHVAMVVRVLTTRGLAPRLRWLALLPPAAPWVAWLAGHRATALAWLGLLVGYVLLRVSG